MTSPANKVLSFLKDKKLIEPADHISVAVSGGADSVCLLYILKELAASLRFQISVLHVNHHTRGEESDKDQFFVDSISKSMGLPFYVYHAENLNKSSSEEKMRIERYRIFKEHHNRHNCKIATAHHLDDQLETFLMRLFKGSGPKGLKSIPAKRDFFIRPLLHLSKNELTDYIKKNKIKHRFDKSNDSPEKLRNKVRQRLTPALQEIFKSDFLNAFDLSLRRLTMMVEEFEKKSVSLFKQMTDVSDNKISIPIDDFLKLSGMRRIIFIEYCFNAINGVSSHIDSFWVEKIKELALKKISGRRFQIKENFWVSRNRDQLIFHKKHFTKDSSKKLYPNATVTFNHFEIEIKAVESAEVVFSRNNNEEFINGDNISFPLTIRSWKKGDFFYPLGMKKKQKLSDFFTNNKKDIFEKNLIPIVANYDQIVWIAGERIDNRYAWNKKVEKTFKLTVRKSLN